MELTHRILARNLREHSRLAQEDIEQITRLSFVVRPYEPNEDLIRQGDRPTAAVLVLSGMVGRYHLLSNGRRQYLSFHIIGDMPDAQGLFLEQMDHALCAMGRAVVAFIPHEDIIKSFKATTSARLRHLARNPDRCRDFPTSHHQQQRATGAAREWRICFCELFYRGRASGVAGQREYPLPLNLVQLGETLGMAIATVNRTLNQLRTSGSVDFRDGVLTIKNWEKLVRIGEFDPRYLHGKKAAL